MSPKTISEVFQVFYNSVKLLLIKTRLALLPVETDLLLPEQCNSQACFRMVFRTIAEQVISPSARGIQAWFGYRLSWILWQNQQNFFPVPETMVIDNKGFRAIIRRND